MQRIVICFIMLALCSGIGYANEGITLATINYPPYIGENLPSHGMASQIVSEAYKRVGYDVKLQFYPWKRAFLYARRGECDGIFTIWYRQEREKWFVFSDSFMASELGFYVRKGEGMQYKKISDLSPYTIGVVSGYAYPLEFMQARLNTESVMKDRLNILKLDGKRVNAIVIDRIVGRYLFNIYLPEKSDMFIFMEPAIKIEKIYLAISKQTKNYQKKVQDFNVGLEQIKQEGLLEQILTTHGALGTQFK